MEKHDRAQKGEKSFEAFCESRGIRWLRGNELVEAIRNWRENGEAGILKDGRSDKAILNWIRKHRKLVGEIEEWNRKHGISGIFDYVCWLANRTPPLFVEVKTGESVTLTLNQLKFYLKFRSEGLGGFAIFWVQPTGETGRASHHLIALEESLTVPIRI